MTQNFNELTMETNEQAEARLRGESTREDTTGALNQQREAQIQKWLEGGARYEINEKGEKHLVLTERQVENARSEMYDSWRSGVTEENVKEITEFILTPGKLEEVPWIDVAVKGGCITCDGPYDVKTLMSKVADPYSGANVNLNDSFFIEGCGRLSLFVYKGEAVISAMTPFLMTGRDRKADSITDLREKFSTA